MIIDKLHKRSQIRIEYPDHSEQRAAHCITNAKGNIMLMIYDLLKDVELHPGDILTTDIKILIEHNHNGGDFK